MNILLLFIAMANAKEHVPAYPRGTETVCFEAVDTNLENPEILKAIAVNGMVQNLKIPDGKFVLGEVKCEQ